MDKHWSERGSSATSSSVSFQTIGATTSFVWCMFRNQPDISLKRQENVCDKTFAMLQLPLVRYVRREGTV